MENSDFISRAEATAIVNNELGDLFDLLISRPTNPFTTLLTFSIATGNTYALASDFQNFRGLDFQCGSEWTEVHRASFAQRNRSAARTLAKNRLFDLIGDTLYVTPSENAVGTYRLWYDPQFVALDEVTVTSIDLPNRWEEYAINGAAATFLAKEESDPSVYLALKAKAEARILAATTERDRGAPRAIVDVSGGCIEDWDGFR